MLIALLYHHWLELRFRVKAAVLPSILLCVLTAVLATVAASDAAAFVVYAWGISGAAVMGGVVFGGTGIQTSLDPARSFHYYTLTLPVARLTLVYTRLCAAAAIAALVMLAVFVAVSTTLWIADQSVQMPAMAASTLLALLLAVGLQAVFGLLMPLVSRRFGPIVLSLIPVGVVFAVVRTLDDSSTGWTHVVRFLMFQPARWDLAGAILVSIATSLLAAVVLVRVRDF